jgi:hypothetical protein
MSLRGTLSSAGSGIFLTALSLAVTAEMHVDPERLPGLFMEVGIATGPVAITFGSLIRQYLETGAADRSSPGTLLLEAHVLGLCCAGLCLIVVLNFVWMYSGFDGSKVWAILPRAASAAAAGGAGLAAGALWRLPMPVSEERP